MSGNYLNNQFIIAMPSLIEPIFHHTVTYLCQHTKEGALGIVINRSAEMKLGEIFKQMDITAAALETAETLVFSGGPVQQDRGFVVHSACGAWDMTLPVSEDISLTTSRDVIEAIAAGEGPKKYLIALGYAGWSEGQLEKEMLSNSWLNTPCAKQILFETPVNQRWNTAASQIGVDINQLTTPAGHC
ncbi:MAG: YqgE/AlgH family protein [Methyloglobulus sp.]|nr:YqgE/AlgH family protein [Pseudomonadota bacterium]MSS75543.1 YqgE/AlgH family protein [Methyloglobulus sp.]